MEGLNKRFNTLVLRLQELNYGFMGEYDLPDVVKVKIELIGKEIKDKKLISKCDNEHFAKQLMIMNNVPEKYWELAQTKQLIHTV